MTIGADYTARIAPSALRAADVSVVCRYIAPQAWKVIGQGEYNELVAAGYSPGSGLLLNWESDAHDWAGGAGHGTDHGQRAAAMARALGYPTGAVIIGSCDFDTGPANVAAYRSAFRQALNAGGYAAGVYGPTDVLSSCAGDGYTFFWQCMSTAFNSGRNKTQNPHTNLWQKGHKTIAGQDCDWSQIISLVPPTPQPAIPPYPGVQQRGSQGGPVKDIQNRLNVRGYRPLLVVDGDFGPLTEAQVRKFQTFARIGVDGIVGPVTWHALWALPIT